MLHYEIDIMLHYEIDIMYLAIQPSCSSTEKIRSFRRATDLHLKYSLETLQILRCKFIS